MGAEDGDGGLLEPGWIERERTRPDIRSKHRGTDAAIWVNAILVRLAKGAVTGVKVRRSVLDGENADALGKGAVECAMKVGRRDRSIDSEGSDLCEGMDASIGSS